MYFVVQVGIFQFIVNDWDSDGSHDLIGEFYTTLTDLEKGSIEVSV